MVSTPSRCLIAVALMGAVALVGCVQKAGEGGSTMSLTNAASNASAIAIEGRAAVPSQLLSNNSAGLIANNGGGLIANNGGGLISPGTSRYGLLATAETPLANALAYLTDPKEQFYKQFGKMITTTTDSQGRYRFAAGVPSKKPVIVNVILPENRRVVGFTVPNSGTNTLDINVATTYVTEFLRQRAAEQGKTMGDFDLKQLPRLAKLTTQAIEAGVLPVPDLGIGKIESLNMTYALAVGKNEQGLGNAWAMLLEKRTIAGTTVAGSGVTDYGGDGKAAIKGEFYRLKGICVDRAGHMYLADEGNHVIRKIDAKTGVLSTIAGTGNRGFSGDGGPATDAQLNFPRAVILDPAGTCLYIFDSQNVRVRKLDLASGVITTFAGDPPPRGNGFFESGHGGDGGPANKARLFSPRGGAFDSLGNLYVCDGLKGTKFHTIRKITPAGVISTIAGVPDTDGAFEGDNGPAAQAKLNYHNQLWITPDDQLYIADTYNNCIRKIDLKSANQVITTVAGIGGKQGDKPDPDGKLATETMLNGPYGVAVDAQGQIFISERGNHRVLVVKKDGRMYTVAGGGTFSGEGDARRLSFSEPHDLFVESDGNLLMTDTRNAKLRRLWTKFGI